MLSLRQKEYDIIDTLSKRLGVSKVDLILSAVKRQYAKSEVGRDYTNHYIALLKSQIEEYEERIKRDREVLADLKDEYQKMMDLRRRVEDGENCEIVQFKADND